MMMCLGRMTNNEQSPAALLEQEDCTMHYVMVGYSGAASSGLSE
jgi:hypothetical protein